MKNVKSPRRGGFTFFVVRKANILYFCHVINRN
jgi:hypothetical protein